MKTLSLAVLPGDGVGPEVVEQAVRVLKAVTELSGRIEVVCEELPVGLAAYEQYGATIPSVTMEGLDRNDACLLGPLTTHLYTSPGMVNASGFLRKTRRLYANIRPVRSYPGLASVHQNMDVVVVRENTEGFYADRNVLDGNGEMRIAEDTVVSVRVVTRLASTKVAEHAFRLARRRGGKRLVTAGHKANVLRRGCGLFLDACRAVHANYPDVRLNDMHVDALAMRLAMKPQDFDVIVTTNMFGDILSDLTAGLVGGLGLAPGLNAGDSFAVAQAVHGSAPDIAGRGVANPCAEVLSAALLLDWLGEMRAWPEASAAGSAIALAVELAIAEGVALTPDLGGSASTVEFGDAIIRALPVVGDRV
jgi:3-isopropylmalate dehydrogenase